MQTTRPPMIPAIAPGPFARFQKMPSRIIGKNEAAASEKAQATIWAISASRGSAASAAQAAATRIMALPSRTRVSTDAFGRSVLK
jgi:hypothetical protein